jgi:hypothetical protein
MPDMPVTKEQIRDLADSYSWAKKAGVYFQNIFEKPTCRIP